MAALTWREVSAPNFGGANDALRTGAQLQQNALSGIGDALRQFQTENSANINSEVLARAFQVNDPAALQKGLSDGSILGGIDPRQIDPKTFAALGNRQSDLLAQQATRQGIEKGAYGFDRTKGLDAIQDAARGATADRLQITDPTLRAQSPEQQLAARQGEVSLRGGQLGNVAREFQNTTQSRDDLVNQVGINTATNIMRESASPTDALAKLEEMNDLSPAEFQSAYQKLQSDFGKFYSPAQPAVAGPGGRGGAPGTAKGSPYDASFNFRDTGTPITSQPIKNVLEVQEESRTTQGHSPMGAFQINKGTLEDFGPKVLGKDWKEQEFTPEVQERLAKEIFDSRKGGDLSKTWSSLPNSSPGAYKDFTWEDMRGILANGEVGQNLPDSPAALRDLSGKSRDEVNRRIAQNNATGVTADIERNLTDTRDAPEIVQELIKTRFPNANQDVLLGEVTRAQRANPGLSAADVASAISRSAAPTSTFNPLSRNFSNTTNFGGDVGVNDDVLKANLDALKTGKADRLSQSNKRTVALGAKVDSAQEKADQAQQDLLALQQRQRIQPGIDTERAEATAERATAALKRALAEQQKDPSFRPVRQ